MECRYIIGFKQSKPIHCNETAEWIVSYSKEDWAKAYDNISTAEPRGASMPVCNCHVRVYQKNPENNGPTKIGRIREFDGIQYTITKISDNT